MCRVCWLRHIIPGVLKSERCWGDVGPALFRPCIMKQPLVAKTSYLTLIQTWTDVGPISWTLSNKCWTNVRDSGPTSLRFMYHEQLPLTKTFYLSGYKFGSLVQHRTNSVIIRELPVAKTYPSVPDISEKLVSCRRCRPDIHPAFARTLLCFLSI